MRCCFTILNPEIPLHSVTDRQKTLGISMGGMCDLRRSYFVQGFACGRRSRPSAGGRALGALLSAPGCGRPSSVARRFSRPYGSASRRASKPARASGVWCAASGAPSHRAPGARFESADVGGALKSERAGPTSRVCRQRQPGALFQLRTRPQLPYAPIRRGLSSSSS